MIQLAICDDDADELKKTAVLIENYCRQNPDSDIVCRMFQSGTELLHCVEAGHRFDIYLLDILMPDKNGIEAAASIRAQDQEAAIIFLSSSDEFGVKAYRVRAYDYLLKPIETPVLFQTLDNLLQTIIERRTNTLPIKTRNGIHSIHPHRLVYVEYQNHRCYYHLDDRTVIESVTLRQPFEEIVPQLMADRRFVKATIAYLVNMAHIKSIQGRTLLLTDGESLPVSRACIMELRKSFMTYLLERGRGK